ncbi:hypothetical protein VNO80_28625 [Phaseolus coccineus]|uniref:Uncharacterized protein n=1 Tax=Phaseolus coccineus TaxID=3886 RepID=A0AAN9LBV8_PHACN
MKIAKLSSEASPLHYLKWNNNSSLLNNTYLHIIYSKQKLQSDYKSSHSLIHQALYQIHIVIKTNSNNHLHRDVTTFHLFILSKRMINITIKVTIGVKQFHIIVQSQIYNFLHFYGNYRVKDDLRLIEQCKSVVHRFNATIKL